MSRLLTMAFGEVVVTPYTDLLDTPRGGEYHRGGPDWPEWFSQTAARHCVMGKPSDVRPRQVPPTSTLAGPVAWAGAVTPHYGHQIADFSTRLLPTLAEMPEVQFAFGTRVPPTFDSRDERPMFRSVAETPPWFRAILDWYGIAADRVSIIIEPTLVERLVVAPQAEQPYWPGPEPWYLDMLDANTASRLGELERRGSLYVSRAAQRSRFAGEAYLEEVLREAGFRVVRPETLSIHEQLRAFSSADAIVFAEGSAMHGMQLLGRALGDVTVLNRRRRMKLGEVALRPRARSLRYVAAIRGQIHGYSRAGQPAPFYGLSIVDPELLAAVLPIDQLWDQRAFEASQNADIEEWLEAERASLRWAVPGSREWIARTMRAAGLEPLALQVTNEGGDARALAPPTE
jgi:Glycosyltransferase 61